MMARAQRMPVPGSTAVSLWRAGEAMVIRANALLAQRMIAWAWKRTLATGAAVKPWPWADVFPVARLEAPRQGAASMVLAGAGGRTLAFGPGHVEGTPLPGDPGNAVVSGHRDTHFSFLRDLRSGDTLVVHSASARVVRYVVVATRTPLSQALSREGRGR